MLVVLPMDPTSAAFMLAENRNQPMHVGGLQLFTRPAGAGPDFAVEMYRSMLEVDAVSPLFLRRPRRTLTTGLQWTWSEDPGFDIHYHVRHNGLPQPGRVRELLELCSRLHSTRLAVERPLWEANLIEGLHDGRIALYTKVHHALVDGVSSMRLLQSVLSTDPATRGMPPPWAADPAGGPPRGGTGDVGVLEALRQLPRAALRTALEVSAEAAGLPLAFGRTVTRGLLNESSAMSFHAPRTIFNTRISGSRRFAAQQWPVERLRAVGQASGTTLNDVVLAMCSGAIRCYLDGLGALPEEPLVAMVPVSLRLAESQTASREGGNAIGAVMVKLGTHLPDPADRLRMVHDSMAAGKDALRGMSAPQILAMTALGLAPAIVAPMLKLEGITRPPFNLIISNVPGPRTPHYYNGAHLQGMYPLSIPIHGMALNITCTSYAGTMGFGLTGCRRSVPHLQRLLVHLDDELAALEKAAGLA